ncbi:hypothetical protein [Psychrobacter okhotskensis]|uniref:hypothetical protein n=1 Tax=Psychrobacter okhotskensis TaxID=212403 RepID=UPI003D03B46F
MKLLQLIQNKRISLIVGLSLLSGVTACQPPSDKAIPSGTTSASVKAEKPPSTPSLAEAKTPKALTTALVALSEDTLTEQLICTKLHDSINAIDNKSKIENIHSIQRQIQACLPTASNAEILQWLADYQAMYQRFLQFDNPTDSAAFFTVMSHVEQGKKITVAKLKQVNPRVRYLIGLVMSRSDVSVRYLGEGDFEFHHDLTAMADIFSPYLPDDQSAFIQRMAKDNQAIFWFDAAIAFSFEALVERAVFWEDFIKRYPKSRFYTDAKALLNTYRYLLFFGSENTQWTDDDIRKFDNPVDEQLMRQLAKRNDSELAQDVQKFFTFMQQSNTERQQRYPVPDKDENGHKINQWEVAHYQLDKALEIPSPWKEDNKDCSTGILCIDSKIE